MKTMMHVVFVAVVYSSLTACGTREPTYGEQIQDEGSAMREVGEEWSEGEALVVKGEKRIRDGEERIRDGERMVEEGREMTREGSERMRSSKLRYERGGGESAY